ncbi:hypothetical protein I4U23_020360 [Adineta vaga]|nr:hypothetical protein I4U23_020360 [Adineta vaga]
MENEESVQTVVNNDNITSDYTVHFQQSRKMNIDRLRKILLLLLSIMIMLSLLYLTFVSLPCMKYTNLWFCQYFNRQYEFSWALVSLVYDGLWLFVTYRYYSKGLLLFAWLSTIFLCVFGVFLIVSLLTIFQTMMYFHLIDTHILIASISSIGLCITTLILQLVIVLFSFRLSKLISKNLESAIYAS